MVYSGVEMPEVDTAPLYSEAELQHLKSNPNALKKDLLWKRVSREITLYKSIRDKRFTQNDCVLVPIAIFELKDQFATALVLPRLDGMHTTTHHFSLLTPLLQSPASLAWCGVVWCGLFGCRKFG